MIGQTLSHYKILQKLGEGGKGEVYRAKDLKLERDVAVKVLREELATDPERLGRFEKEARAASALNHPDIVTIHDIRKHGTIPFIVMELVEGKTRQSIGWKTIYAWVSSITRISPNIILCWQTSEITPDSKSSWRT